jgi:hypothetical protein
MIDGYRLALHGNLECSSTEMAADFVAVRVSHFKGVRSLGDLRNLGHSAALGAEAVRELGQRPKNQRFPGESKTPAL